MSEPSAPPAAPAHDPATAHGIALLVIDMVNCFDFPEAEMLKPRAERAAPVIGKLIDEARSGGYPVVYVNDNFGHWHSDRAKLIEEAETAANSMTLATLRPKDSDYFIVKPQFSGFYATNLPVLLPKLGVANLILTGIATDICVLFTAADAHMRDYRLWVPEDAVAAENDERGNWALEIMRQSMEAETRPAETFGIAEWSRRIGATNG